MIKISTVDELFEAAVHFGHRVGNLHPQMKPYVYSIKTNVNLIDLEKTRECLKKSLDFVKEVAAKNGKILFVGTKAVAQTAIKKYAEEVQMPYVVERWLGGTLTNFSTINDLVEKLKKMEKEKAADEWEKYTKKERLDLDRELKRLELYVGGIKNLDKLPEAIYIVDLKKEKTAVREAKRVKIKSIGLVDANCDPTTVNFPIPGNDDAIKSIEIITKLIVEAIKEGQQTKKK